MLRFSWMACALVAPVASLPLTKSACAGAWPLKTDLSETDLARALSAYEMAVKVGPYSDRVAELVSEAMGGVWDVLMWPIDSTCIVSYSIYCSQHATLANEDWEILLCRQADDADHKRCFPYPQLQNNGRGYTSAPRISADFALTSTTFTQDPRFNASVIGKTVNSSLHALKTIDKFASRILNMNLFHESPYMSWNVLLRDGICEDHSWYFRSDVSVTIAYGNDDKMATHVWNRDCMNE